MGLPLSLAPGVEPFPGFRLRQLRGKGGFAEVWETQTSDGRLIALKFMACSDTTAAAKELRAIQSIQKLNHKNLIRTEKVWSLPGYVVIAMELADGSLLDLLDAFANEFGTPIDFQSLSGYMIQAAQVLDFLNARQHIQDGRRVGFQHCDIKPSNLLIVGETLKLADFGLATPTTATSNSYTRWGTLDFAAPEIYRGILTERSDQFSFGVTYHFLRTAHFPFPPPPPKFTKSYVRPAPNLSRLPAAERPIVAKALSPMPDQRWRSCLEFVTELLRVNGMNPSVLDIEVPKDTSKPMDTSPLV